MEDQELLCTITKDQTLTHGLCLDVLFSNFEFITDEEKILSHFDNKNWLDISHEIIQHTGFRVVNKTMVRKGCNWDKCPQTIKDHFLTLQKGHK